MLQHLAKHWWVFLLRGIAAILFGLFAYLMPGLTLATLVLFWGGYAFADGVIALWSAWKGDGKKDDRWLLGLQGVIGLAAGIITIAAPGATAVGLLIAIAAWSLVTGVLQIAAAVRLRDEIEGEFWLGLSGVLSVLFALFIMARPGEGALAITWLIGFYAILFGVAMVAFAFRIKREIPA